MNLTAAKIRKHVEYIRNGANTFLIDTAQLKRKTGEEYIDGESRPMYAAPELIACRLITRSGSESQNIAAQPRQVQQNTYTGLYRMQVPYTVDVTEGDQILYTDAVTGIIRTADVIYAPAKHIYTAAYIIHLQEVH